MFLLGASKFLYSIFNLEPLEENRKVCFGGSEKCTKTLIHTVSLAS